MTGLRAAIDCLGAQLLLEPSNFECTVRDLEIEVDDAIEIAETIGI